MPSASALKRTASATVIKPIVTTAIEILTLKAQLQWLLFCVDIYSWWLQSPTAICRRRRTWRWRPGTRRSPLQDIFTAAASKWNRPIHRRRSTSCRNAWKHSTSSPTWPTRKVRIICTELTKYRRGGSEVAVCGSLLHHKAMCAGVPLRSNSTGTCFPVTSP